MTGVRSKGVCGVHSSRAVRRARRMRELVEETTTAPATTSPATTSRGRRRPRGPGAGKPPMCSATRIHRGVHLGALYQQALEAKGYQVTVKGNIGSSELIYKSLTSGQIVLYPEYTGTLLTAVAV